MAGQLLSVLLTEYTQINRQGYAPLRNWDAWRTCGGGGARRQTFCLAGLNAEIILSRQSAVFDGTCQVAPGLLEEEEEAGGWRLVPGSGLDSCQPLGAQRDTNPSMCWRAD